MRIDSPTTKAELEKVLDEVIQSAHSNGVKVDNGGYLLNKDNGTPDWDLTIIRLGNRNDEKS